MHDFDEQENNLTQKKVKYPKHKPAFNVPLYVRQFLHAVIHKCDKHPDSIVWGIGQPNDDHIPVEEFEGIDDEINFFHMVLQNDIEGLCNTIATTVVLQLAEELDRRHSFPYDNFVHCGERVLNSLGIRAKLHYMLTVDNSFDPSIGFEESRLLENLQDTIENINDEIENATDKITDMLNNFTKENTKSKTEQEPQGESRNNEKA